MQDIRTHHKKIFRFVHRPFYVTTEPIKIRTELFEQNIAFLNEAARHIPTFKISAASPPGFRIHMHSEWPSVAIQITHTLDRKRVLFTMEVKKQTR